MRPFEKCEYSIQRPVGQQRASVVGTPGFAGIDKQVFALKSDQTLEQRGLARAIIAEH